ncbi:hypothetical protein CC1G_07028 [Coprinopsis cinerea okayama7|uniref:DUF6699 domain-containing protein n=1 Tax=Coprinopsis cinerea (strain Okayama-7 / 130 / ATCC MYA-4618 / FGSC 9003) TaxID=240176 RepID=A8NAX5_COPC7|nr:hypothetical protein CC1G_07028 [Coprinopsis cinerea okayama7\|eukprot:XP_001831977.1 hypothetical protein CC1G_07028 [Coprinopsis cinerea okayama7\
MGYLRKMFLGHSVFNSQSKNTPPSSPEKNKKLPAEPAKPTFSPTQPPFFNFSPGYYSPGFSPGYPYVSSCNSSPAGSPMISWNESKAQSNECYFTYKKPEVPTIHSHSIYPSRPPLSRDSSFSSLSSVSSDSSVFSEDCSTPPVPKNPTNASEISLAVKSKCRVSFSNPTKQIPVFMHPLFALSSPSLQRAPINYDAAVAPSNANILDFVGDKIPVSTLLEPATEPPIRGKLVLEAEDLPWTIVVHASGNACGPGAMLKPSPHSSPTTTRATAVPKHKFYIDEDEDSDYDDDDDDDVDSATVEQGSSDAVVSNLDVLCAVHTSLGTPITQKEWESLGNDSPDQRRVARAYRKRCKDTGDSLNDGVKRIDFLKQKTCMVGVASKKKDVEECERYASDMLGRGDEIPVVGKILFGEVQAAEEK